MSRPQLLRHAAGILRKAPGRRVAAVCSAKLSAKGILLVSREAVEYLGTTRESRPIFATANLQIGPCTRDARAIETFNAARAGATLDRPGTGIGMGAAYAKVLLAAERYAGISALFLEEMGQRLFLSSADSALPNQEVGEVVDAFGALARTCTRALANAPRVGDGIRRKAWANARLHVVDRRCARKFAAIGRSAAGHANSNECTKHRLPECFHESSSVMAKVTVAGQCGQRRAVRKCATNPSTSTYLSY